MIGRAGEHETYRVENLARSDMGFYAWINLASLGKIYRKDLVYQIIGLCITCQERENRRRKISVPKRKKKVRYSNTIVKRTLKVSIVLWVIELVVLERLRGGDALRLGLPWV